MGTTYNITVGGGEPARLKNNIDQLLVDINQEVSTYIDSSSISMFNKADKEWEIQDTGNRFHTNEHFRKNFDAAKKIYAATEGAFDPTIMPLVNYWGFGYTPQQKVTAVDSQKVAKLVKTVGFDKVNSQFFEKEKKVKIVKENPGSQLDFSAIAKGYGVDAVAKLIEKEGITDYFVEIGGETRVKGKNPDANPWRVGINTPKDNVSTQEIYSIVELQDNAIATSGNYQNFHIVDGQKYGHTINPQTGFPEINTTLSASVIATDCMTADAYATAFMTMGHVKAMQIVAANPELEAYLIYAKADGSMAAAASAGMAKFLK